MNKRISVWRPGFLVALVATALMPLAAYSLDPAPFAPPPAGTKMTFVNKLNDIEYTRTFQATDDYRTKMLDAEGKEIERILLCDYCAGNELNIDEYAAIWPLEVGKRVTFNRIGRTSAGTPATTRNSIKVDDVETLNLRFGSVKTYKVSSTGTGVGRRWKGKVVRWYAPTVGWWVRIELSDNEGRKEEVEVVDIVRP